MKLSTKGRYGLRAILYLAIHSEMSHVALHQIAENQELSVGYTEQIFSTLRRAGIVKSVKGAQGGYVLAESPGNLTIGTILKALEGDLSIDINDPATQGNLFEQSIRRMLWQPMDAKVLGLLETLTLQDLVTDYKNNQQSFVDFVI